MMKAMGVEMQVIQDIDIIVYAAFSKIIADDLQGWIRQWYLQWLNFR